MKRMHIHLSVKSLEPSISFYSKLFSSEPTVQKEDYAKWMLEDPRLNFAISTRTGKSELEHFGFQVDTEEELSEIRSQLDQQNIDMQNEGKTVCCYMESDKSWIQDPDMFPWEIYQSMKEAQFFNNSSEDSSQSACCTPMVKGPGSGCR